MDNNDITFNSDNDYISNLGGKTYLGAVSPWFFTVSSYIHAATCLLNLDASSIIPAKISSSVSTTGSLVIDGSC